MRLFEQRILNTIARHYSIQNDLLQKREVRSREDVSSYNHTLQQPDGIIFSKASVDKNIRRRIKHEPCTPLLHTKVATFFFDVLIRWRQILPRPDSLFWTRPFLNWLMTDNRIENWLFKKWDFSSKSRLNFGMVGTYNIYFSNTKRKSKVIFHHRTTLKIYSTN